MNKQTKEAYEKLKTVTVGKLIEELSKLDPDLPIVERDDFGDVYPLDYSWYTYKAFEFDSEIEPIKVLNLSVLNTGRYLYGDEDD